MTQNDIEAFKRFDRAIRYMRSSIDPLVPSQVIAAFNAVAMNEGITLTELANILGTNVSTASRQLLDLGERNRKMEQGYMLVDRKQDPNNLRVNRYTLTPKGRLLFQEIASIMKD